MYWQLSAYYFFHFAALGILLPYFGLYLSEIGFNPLQIGTIFAISLGTKVVAPNIWAWISDRSGNYMVLVRISSLAAMLSMAALFSASTFPTIAVTMLIFSFFWNAILPQMEATTMNYLGNRGDRYGRIRLWGSVGFIVAVGAVGMLIQRLGVGVVVPALLVAATGIAISTLWVQAESRPVKHSAGEQQLGRLLRQPAVAALFGAFLLMQASHAPYYSFFTLYLKQHQVPTDFIGLLWVVGVLAEILLFVYSHRLLANFPLRGVFLFCFVITALRWYLILKFPDMLWLVLLAQLLHAISFGAYHAAAINWIHRTFSGAVQHRGQALYNSLSFGVGGAVGSYISGLLWQQVGATSIWWFAIGASMMALVLVWFAPQQRS